jgi:hypothetical protein
MSKDLFNRYIWIVDTIKRYGRISRRELDRRWRNSPYSDGEGLARRTFYNYRQAIEDLFKINIECDPTTYEYYIDDNGNGEGVTNWLLNSVVTNNVLSDSREVSSRIFLEDIPSAREHLSTVVDALKEYRTLSFSYAPFTRLLAREVVLEPYFLKLFHQRWYVTGRNVREDTLKTYALDRMFDAIVGPDHYEVPEGFDAEEFCRDTFGIVFTQGETKHVTIRTDSQQARYLRALPLHGSQQEMIHDKFSIFHYNLKLTPDLVGELLRYGPNIVVLEPPELRAMMLNQLRATLDLYSQHA